MGWILGDCCPQFHAPQNLLKVVPELRVIYIFAKPQTFVPVKGLVVMVHATTGLVK